MGSTGSTGATGATGTGPTGTAAASLGAAVAITGSNTQFLCVQGGIAVLATPAQMAAYFGTGGTGGTGGAGFGGGPNALHTSGAGTAQNTGLSVSLSNGIVSCAVYTGAILGSGNTNLLTLGGTGTLPAVLYVNSTGALYFYSPTMGDANTAAGVFSGAAWAGFSIEGTTLTLLAGATQSAMASVGTVADAVTGTWPVTSGASIAAR